MIGTLATSETLKGIQTLTHAASVINYGKQQNNYIAMKPRANVKVRIFTLFNKTKIVNLPINVIFSNQMLNIIEKLFVIVI